MTTDIKWSHHLSYCLLPILFTWHTKPLGWACRAVTHQVDCSKETELEQVRNVLVSCISRWLGFLWHTLFCIAPHPLILIKNYFWPTDWRGEALSLVTEGFGAICCHQTQVHCCSLQTEPRAFLKRKSSQLAELQIHFVVPCVYVEI